MCHGLKISWNRAERAYSFLKIFGNSLRMSQSSLMKEIINAWVVVCCPRGENNRCFLIYRSKSDDREGFTKQIPDFSRDFQKAVAGGQT